jgi:hypothetical protein
VRHSEIKFVEFSRIAQGGQAANRSFDLTITKLKDNTTISFASIEKEEQRLLTEYFKSAGIKMRVVDPETLQRQVLSSMSESEEEEKEVGGKRKAHEKAKQRQGQDAEMAELDSDDEDDESFDENEVSGSDDDGESGEEE